MKRTIIWLIATTLIISCKKDKQPKDNEAWPQRWVLVVDNNDPLFYKMLMRVGSTILRSDQAKENFNAATMAGIHECEWLVQLRGNGVISLQLAKDTATYLLGVQNPLTNEYMLTPGIRRDYNQQWLFRFHSMQNVNDRKTVALESVEYPGYYFSNTGPIGTGNGVKLEQHDKPQDAKWFIRF